MTTQSQLTARRWQQTTVQECIQVMSLYIYVLSMAPECIACLNHTVREHFK